MKIRTIRVGMGTTIQTRPYENLRTDVSLDVELDEGERPEDVRADVSDRLTDLWADTLLEQVHAYKIASPQK